MRPIDAISRHLDVQLKLIDMKVTRLISVTSLALLSIVSARAEINEGVLPLTNKDQRADVHAEAVMAARNEHSDAASSRVAPPRPNPASRVVIRAEAIAAARNEHADVDLSRVAAALPTPFNRSALRAEAVATAHASNQNLDRKAFFNSEIPPQFGGAKWAMQ
jgi:hypothetical protein